MFAKETFNCDIRPQLGGGGAGICDRRGKVELPPSRFYAKFLTIKAIFFAS